MIHGSGRNATPKATPTYTSWNAIFCILYTSVYEYASIWGGCGSWMQMAVICVCVDGMQVWPVGAKYKQQILGQVGAKYTQNFWGQVGAIEYVDIAQSKRVLIS